MAMRRWLDRRAPMGERSDGHGNGGLTVNVESSSVMKKKSAGFWEVVKTVFYAVLIAIVVRTVAYEPFRIPTGYWRRSAP